jgi:hypothetical protein
LWWAEIKYKNLIMDFLNFPMSLELFIHRLNFHSLPKSLENLFRILFLFLKLNNENWSRVNSFKVYILLSSIEIHPFFPSYSYSIQPKEEVYFTAISSRVYQINQQILLKEKEIWHRKLAIWLCNSLLYSSFSCC